MLRSIKRKWAQHIQQFIYQCGDGDFSRTSPAQEPYAHRMKKVDFIIPLNRLLMQCRKKSILILTYPKKKHFYPVTVGSVFFFLQNFLISQHPHK